MELEGDTHFFTLHTSALFQFLPSNMSYFSIQKCSMGVDTVTPWSPQPSSQGLCVLDPHPGHKALSSRLAAVPYLWTAPFQCPSCGLIHQTFSSRSDFQIQARLSSSIQAALLHYLRAQGPTSLQDGQDLTTLCHLCIDSTLIEENKP